MGGALQGMDELYSRLEAFGFERKEYPDGWYWVLMPASPEAKEKLSTALGFEEELWDGPPDTVFLQLNEASGSWQFCFDAEYGDLSSEEAMDVLDMLEEADA